MAQKPPSRKKAIPAGGLIVGLALAAGCAAMFLTGPVIGLYFANRTLRKFRGPFRIATAGALVSVVSLILDATISHTQPYSLEAVGNSNLMYQYFSAHTNISAFFDPGAAFFLTHLGIILGWVMIGVSALQARRLSKRQMVTR